MALSSENIRLFLTLCLHVAYRLLQWVVVLVQELYWKYCGLTGKIRSQDCSQPVQILNILLRHKYDPEQVACDYNFLFTHAKMAPFELLNSSHWSLYCISREFAYFVFLPFPFAHYNAKEAPFVYVNQFEDAVLLARISLNRMEELAELLKPNSNTDIVLFTNTARGGSTLLAKMMHVEGHSLVIAEPLVLTHLAIAKDEGLGYFPPEHLMTLLKSSLQLLAKDTPAGQVCILKTTSSEARLVPLVSICYPSIKHIFMFRNRGYKSVLRMLMRDQTYHLTTALRRVSNELVAWINLLAISESRWDRVIKPKELFEYGAIVYASPYTDYLENQDLFDLPAVLFEDLIADPQKVLQSLFDTLRLPREKIADALQLINHDSQAGTFLSHDKMKAIEAAPLTDYQVKRLKEIANIMAVDEKIFQ